MSIRKTQTRIKSIFYFSHTIAVEEVIDLEVIYLQQSLKYCDFFNLVFNTYAQRSFKSLQKFIIDEILIYAKNSFTYSKPDSLRQNSNPHLTLNKSNRIARFFYW